MFAVCLSIRHIVISHFFKVGQNGHHLRSHALLELDGHAVDVRQERFGQNVLRFSERYGSSSVNEQNIVGI
jgi:hypothetical protein